MAESRKVKAVLNLAGKVHESHEPAAACAKLRQFVETGSRDEILIRNLAKAATRNISEDDRIEKIREAIVDNIIKIEIENIMGGPVGELRVRLAKILDAIESRIG